MRPECHLPCRPDPQPAPSVPCGLRGYRELYRGSGVQGRDRPARGPAAYPRTKQRPASGPCRQKPQSPAPGKTGPWRSPSSQDRGLHKNRARRGAGTVIWEGAPRLPRRPSPVGSGLDPPTSRQQALGRPQVRGLRSLALYFVPQVPAPHLVSGLPVRSYSSFTLSSDLQTSPPPGGPL